MPTYRYQFKGVNINDVNALLPKHSAALVDFTPTVLADISADAEDKNDLDGAMASKGYTYIETLP